ncbi:MAG TPA: HD domain-containing phosphohydrolase [Streptosporangiaceae bacterium]
MAVQQQGATGRRRAAWQTLDSGQLLLISSVALLVVVAVTQVTAVGLDHASAAVVFGALIAIGELARMEMPGGREVAPIASAAGLGYALLVGVGDDGVTYSALQVVTVAAVGMLIGSLPHIAVGRSPHIDAMARRLASVSLVAFCFRPVAASGLHDVWGAMLAIMAVLAMLSCAVDVTIAAVIRSETVRIRLGIALLDEARAKMRLCAATGATGMLIAVSTSTMGLAALVVFTAPILVAQVAFRKYATVHATYLQTVRALSRVAEVGGYVETGHARRVAQLSIGMGRELGQAEPELLELEYAALMHDIGQLSLRDPIPGGATVLASPAEQRRIAELGADVIKQTGVLDRVAEIVRRQCDPYRVGVGKNTAPPLASRIIKVANAYDDLVGDSTDRDRAAAVLERLRLDSTSEYDPAVVEALGRVVDRATPVDF